MSALSRHPLPWSITPNFHDPEQSAILDAAGNVVIAEAGDEQTALFIVASANASTWQTINTAPMDGTVVILSGMDNGVGPGRWQATGCYEPEGREGCEEAGWYSDVPDVIRAFYQPTHWRPLLPNPTD